MADSTESIKQIIRQLITLTPSVTLTTAPVGTPEHLFGVLGVSVESGRTAGLFFHYMIAHTSLAFCLS